jgi:hypothetical protein
MLGLIRDKDIGGGIARRLIRLNGEVLTAGTGLTREQVLGIRAANRQALINTGALSIYPRPRGAAEPESVKAADHQPEIEHAPRHVVSRGFGKYDVIQGVVLNAEPLAKDAAFAIAGTEMPAATPAKPKGKGKH